MRLHWVSQFFRRVYFDPSLKLSARFQEYATVDDYVFECSNGARIFSLRCCMYWISLGTFWVENIMHILDKCASYCRIRMDTNKLVWTRIFHKRSGYLLWILWTFYRRTYLKTNGEQLIFRRKGAWLIKTYNDWLKHCKHWDLTQWFETAGQRRRQRC